VKYLRDSGIFLAQGYAFARPLPGAQFRELVEAAHPLGEAAGPTLEALMARRAVAA
jgi:sensor c-di-GMP phosphodiesterase-like protein